jgi:hypothetical protein
VDHEGQRKEVKANGDPSSVDRNTVRLEGMNLFRQVPRDETVYVSA